MFSLVFFLALSPASFRGIVENNAPTRAKLRRRLCLLRRPKGQSTRHCLFASLPSSRPSVLVDLLRGQPWIDTDARPNQVLTAQIVDEPNVDLLQQLWVPTTGHTSAELHAKMDTYSNFEFKIVIMILFCLTFSATFDLVFLNKKGFLHFHVMKKNKVVSAWEQDDGSCSEDLRSLAKEKKCFNSGDTNVKLSSTCAKFDSKSNRSVSFNDTPDVRFIRASPYTQWKRKPEIHDLEQDVFANAWHNSYRHGIKGIAPEVFPSSFLVD